MEIGYKLKIERENRSWTQEEVAKKLNVSRSTISSWEVGRTYPDLDALVAISDLYEVSLDALLREDTTMVEKITKDSKKGRKVKWIIAAIIIILLPLSFYLGTKFMENTFYSIPIESLKSANVVVEEPVLSSNSEVKLSIDFPDGQKYKSFTPQIQGETLYITIWTELGSSKESDVTIPLSSFENTDLKKISEIIIIQDDKNIEKDFSKSPQKIIWEKQTD